MRTLTILAISVALFVASPVWATDGMNAISAGARAAGMGGVDQAIATDTAAMNTNPAGITQSVMQIGIALSPLIPTLTLNDQVSGPQGTTYLNKNLAAEHQVFPLLNAGFSMNVWEGLYLGIGFYVQGGMGATFKGYNTFADDDPRSALATQPWPTQYDTSSEIMFMKLTPTIAYRFQVREDADVSLGLAYNVGFSKMGFTHSGMQFSEEDSDHVYVPHRVSFDGNYTFGQAMRLGLLVRSFDGALRVGASYQSEAKLPYVGTTTLDEVLAYDGEMEFFWPQEVGMGVAGSPLEELLLGLEMKWINWSSTMGTLTLKNAAAGSVPEGYERLDMPFKMNWKDQLVFGLGGDYQLFERFSLRAGYHYGKSPVRENGINPLFPAVTEHHITAGVGIVPIEGLHIDAAVEYVPESEVTSCQANQLAFEPGGQEGNGYQVSVAMSQLTLHLGVNYEF